MYKRQLLRSVPSETEGLTYDINDFCRQLLSNYAQKLYAKVSSSYIEKRFDEFKKYKDEFLELLDDIDKMLASRPEWTIQKWISDARALGTTPEEKDLYEYHARITITIWGNEQNLSLIHI